MNKKYLLGALLFAGSMSFAQNVTFSDTNFKNKLVSATTANEIAKDLAGNFFKIDANSDGQIQLTEAAQVSYIDVTCNSCVTATKINTLGGIDSFTNLKTFIFRGQSIDNIVISGLAQLEEIDAALNETAAVNITGATGLKRLYVSSGNLSFIDATVFPNLEELQCQDNGMVEVNVAGMATLKKLTCGMNPMTSIDLTGLTSLEVLGIGETQISVLNLAMVPNLQELSCQDADLTALDFSAQTNLKRLICSGNSIATLDLTGFPNLEYVHCFNNQLTTLDVSGATNLTYLNCGQNQIATLNVSGMVLLKDLICNNNQIAVLDLTGMTVLDKLECNNNVLTSIDTNDCILLKWVDVSDNPPLQYAFFKNGSYENEIGMSNTPNIIYACGDDFDVDYLEGMVPATCHVNTYCSFEPGGTTYTIQGNNRYDMAGNGCDASDINYPNLKFNITTGTTQSTLISNTSGAYDVVVQQGTHVLVPVLENPSYFTVSPSLVSVPFPSAASPATRNFCLTANGSHADLEVTLLPIDVARPGFAAKYRLVYKNKGTMTQSGTVSFGFNDDLMNFASANPAATASAGNLNWDFSNLLPFETRQIDFSLNINSPTATPPVNADDVLAYTATIASSQTEETPSDNVSDLNQIVVNSFDPNDKTCVEGATISTTKVGDYVHYLIRFENTGTFPAENIVVKDVIDQTKFNVASLIPIHGSHPFETRISSANQVEFIFENINLPFDDANNDGYVAFKIKTKPTLVAGDTFANSASIYFDYNFPIVTDPATTTVQLLGNPDFDFSDAFALYPNPAKNTLNIHSKNGVEAKSVSIYNMLGQLLQVETGNAAIDVSALQTGQYFLKVYSEKGNAVTKFIKQ